ncbi:MAG: RpsU-divergently transcribed [Sphingomonadales bacterium 32-68-7]|nr:MAG: RpsU-divergently transcribed [Sphingomonadales bacterium 12-68-11]OYX08339.1 MAG: RpsU-divergently transcribed [Sphingomonadales bacterium 32-68-7]
MSAAPNPDDRTLDELRLVLAPVIAQAAVFDGWSEAALAQAASTAGIDPAVARLAFPGGAADMIAAWIETIDAAMEHAFADGALAGLKIRERIRALVLFRLDAVAGREEALQRAWAIQALPQNLAQTARIAWRSADVMWRLAGDTATDYNHYTKRALLAGIYSATVAVFMGDESEGKADTRAFLDRRIDGVMRFEKAKARLLTNREGFDVARFLGRLRYPAR